MNPIPVLTSRPATLPTLEPAVGSPSTRLQSMLQGLSLTLLGPAGQIEGPGGELRIRLETPTVGPEDIPLNEFLQQLDGLESLPTAPMAFGAAVDALVGSSQAFAQGMLADPPIDAATAAELAKSFESRATVVEISIRDVIENSTYPNYSDFLKELVRVSQELRELATTAKLAAIEANYELMQSAATQMLEAANKAKESRDEQIAAEKKEAIGQMVAGSLSVVTSVVFGGIGIGYANAAIAQFGTSLSQGMSDIIKGATSYDAAGDKLVSSQLQLQSDLANVAKQRLEAAAKLIDQQVAIADDIRETAKNLRDMILKLYQDFISSQNQVIQRANV